LVLSRKSHESVIVGGSQGLPRVLKITVLEITGTRVSLGFEGDADIPVNRLEVWARRNVAGPAQDPPIAASLQAEAARWADDGEAERLKPAAANS
jgi:sRNA-binding carbon storage regulator CsrA